MNKYLTQFSSYSLKNLGNQFPSLIYIQNRPRVFFSDPSTPLLPLLHFSKPGLGLLNQYWPHLHNLNSPSKVWSIAFQRTQELQEWPSGSEVTNWLSVPLPLHHFSKTWTWITQPILATFTQSKFVLKGVIHNFPTNPGTPRMAQ